MRVSLILLCWTFLLLGCGSNSNVEGLSLESVELLPPKYDLTGRWISQEYNCTISDFERGQNMAATLENSSKSPLDFTQEGHSLKMTTSSVIGAILADKYIITANLTEAGIRMVVIDKGIVINENNISGTVIVKSREEESESVIVTCNYKMVRA